MTTYYEITCGDCKVKYKSEDSDTECKACGSTNITVVEKTS